MLDDLPKYEASIPHSVRASNKLRSQAFYNAPATLNKPYSRKIEQKGQYAPLVLWLKDRTASLTLKIKMK